MDVQEKENAMTTYHHPKIRALAATHRRNREHREHREHTIAIAVLGLSLMALAWIAFN